MAINRQFLNDNHAELVAEILAEGHAEGLAAGQRAGAEAERARITAIEAAAMPGCEALIAQFKLDGQTTGEQAAAKILAHYKGINSNALAALTNDANALLKVPANPSPGGDANQDAAEASLPIEERAKARFERDPKIRAEFGTVERYTGWLKHEEKRQAE